MNYLCAQEEESMRLVRVERAHLTMEPLDKRGNNHNKKLKFQMKNNQGNTHNPSNSLNGLNKRFKEYAKYHFCKRKRHYKADCYKFNAWMNNKKN